MTIIETFNLSKSFNGLKAVDNVNLKVEDGEIFGLLGPNGAGKTTLISILCTLIKPSSGKAKLNGFDVVEESSEVRKSIGIVFQDPSLDTRLTAIENLKFHASLYKVPKEEREKRMKEVLELVDLKDKTNFLVRNFSSGMKRRLEIARALLHYPKVLFLDEPTIGLDPATRLKIWNYILELKKREDMTIFLTTHYMEEADYLCNRIAIMNKGKIIVIDKPDNLKRRIKGDVVIVEANNNLEKLKDDLKRLDYVESINVIKNKLYLNVENSEKVLSKLIEFFRKRKIKITSINVRKPSLDDVFIYYAGREIADESFGEETIFKYIARRRV